MPTWTHDDRVEDSISRRRFLRRVAATGGALSLDGFGAFECAFSQNFALLLIAAQFAWPVTLPLSV